MTNVESRAAAGAAAPEEREIITPDTILRRFKLYDDIVSKLRQQNLENGLDIIVIIIVIIGSNSILYSGISFLERTLVSSSINYKDYNNEKYPVYTLIQSQ